MKVTLFLHCSKGYEAIGKVNRYDSDLYRQEDH
jgi:hypothetical protein